MNNIFLRAATIVFLLSTSIAFGQTTSAVISSFDMVNTRLMRLSDVREGMRGVARSVFKGTEPEEFNVEIIGVVPGGIGPKQDLIVGRISGGPAERTGVFAGMSGSPVYVDGKLIGAISYSFPFSKEPMCGITPIEQMISIFENKSKIQASASEPRSFSFAEMVSSNNSIGFEGMTVSDGARVSGMSSNSMLMAVAGQTFRPIATPITFSGFSQATLDRFSPELLKAGLIPVAAAGGSSNISPLKPSNANTLTGGRSVSMHLARGDYGLAASGTVTLRDGDKIYAFGHPFLGLGTSDLAMSESHVVTVVPSINNSFKLAVSDSMVGSMTQDRATGVFGKLGTAPKMIPVKLKLMTSRGDDQVYDFEIARDDVLTPLLLNVTLYNTLVAQERNLGESTIVIDGNIRIRNQAPIKMQRRFAGVQAFQIAAGSVSAPIGALLRGQFSDLDFDGISLDLTIEDGSSTATIDRLAIDKNQVKAGETLEIQAFARTNAGNVFVHRIPVKLDADLPAGVYSVTVGDGNTTQKNEAIQQFVPKNLSEMIDTINKVRLPDRLYAKIARTSTGVVIGTSEMPNLPPSVLATLNNDRMTGGIKPSVQTVVKIVEIPPAKFIINGEQTLMFEVVK
ncbi:MAG: SpoIVB peptidase S55 domain-containing protein [Pyrinomonadaceae bacterium]